MSRSASLRVLVAGALLAYWALPAWSAEETVEVPTTGGTVAVEVDRATSAGAHPAVIILHGREQLDAGTLPFFRRYAAALAAAGMDAYIPSYYTQADFEVMSSPDRRRRVAYFARHVESWARYVGEVADFALNNPHSAGRVGLLGFSNGGFLAVAVADLDPKISALVVFYGGIPDFLLGKITRLPPLLELHGKADQTIIVSRGTKIVDAAHALGVAAEQIVYPGVGHSFDQDAGSASAKDAMQRTLAFLKQRLEVP